MGRLRPYLLSPWIPFVALVIGDFLMMADFVPRSASYILTIIAVVFVLRAPRQHALFFTLASFPLTPALPVPGFDTLALWRLIVLALVLREAWNHRRLLRTMTLRALWQKLLFYEKLGVGFFVLAFLSLFIAVNPVAGLRQLIFLLNAVVLYVLLRVLFAEEPRLRENAMRGLFVALLSILLLGIAQYAIVSFTSLFEFWQGWALDAIPVFYGEASGQNLAASNTWFSYYPDSPPTLRMFSLLPDSHSFGLLMLFGFLFILALQIERQRLNVRGVVALSGFTLALYLSGSRGIWLSAVPVILVALTLLWQLRRRGLASVPERNILMIAIVLVMGLFPVASSITGRAHGAGIREASEQVAFKRAESIFDLTETSNKSRLGIWKASGRSVLQHPLLGLGLGNAAAALNEDVSSSRRGASAHNLYLNFAVETGVLGGFFLLAFFLALFLTPLRDVFRKSVPLGFPLMLVLMAVWVGCYNLFDVVLLNDRALLVFLVLLALPASLQGVRRQQNKNTAL